MISHKQRPVFIDPLQMQRDHYRAGTYLMPNPQLYPVRPTEVPRLHSRIDSRDYNSQEPAPFAIVTKDVIRPAPHTQQLGGNPAAIATAIISGAQAVDKVMRAAKPATKIHDALVEKYGDSGGNNLVKFGRWATGKLKQIGWGIDGTPIYETQERSTVFETEAARAARIRRKNAKKPQKATKPRKPRQKN